MSNSTLFMLASMNKVDLASMNKVELANINNVRICAFKIAHDMNTGPDEHKANY